MLHVDDDPDLADLSRTFLERVNERLEVHTATSASAGCEHLETHDVDCVVSDFDMPGSNGLDFLESVRANHSELPFILFTGKGSEEVASKAISDGVTDYLQKESGSSQYTVLANRIENAVAQYRTQAALETSQRQLSLFFEQSPLGVVQWDEEFDIVRLNAAAEDILDYDEHDLVGEPWEVLVPEADRSEIADVVVSNILADEGGYHSINENVRADGEHIVCEWHNRVVTDAEDEVLAVFSQFQDVTERRERQRRLETLIDNLPGMVYRCTKERGWPMEYVRGEVEALSGYDRETIEGEEGFWGEEVIHPDDREDVWTAVDEAVEDREPFEVTYRIVTKGGETRWVWERGRRIDGVDGDVDVLEGFITDVTERKEKTHELERERAFIDQALDALDDVFYVVDAEGSIQRWNDRLTEITGYSDGEIKGMQAIELFPEDDQERIARAITEAMETGRATVRADVKTADGQRFPVHLTGSRLTDTDGDATGLVGIGRRIEE